MDIYPQKSAKKTLVTCVGYIQKRLGSRLRKLKRTNKGPLSEGRLTDKMINKLQDCSGIAFRLSAGKTIFKMKNAIGVALFRCVQNHHI